MEVLRRDQHLRSSSGRERDMFEIEFDLIKSRILVTSITVTAQWL